MPHPPASQTKLAFAIASSLFWPWFLVWTVIAFVLMPFGIGGHHIQEWVSNAGLQETLGFLLKWFDTVWFVLAAANVYFYTVAAEGQAVARRWAGALLIATALLTWTGAATGFPFGPFYFTGRLGLRFGEALSLTVPLLWFTIITASRYAVLAVFPKARGGFLALGTATLVLLTDLNLESVAWKVRYYWRWFPAVDPQLAPAWPPVQNFIAWFVAAFLLTLLLRSPSPSRSSFPLKPVLVLGLMNAVFLAVHLLR